nr:MAG TPA: hypothetical protein [Caudoviricetes sp.]
MVNVVAKIRNIFLHQIDKNLTLIYYKNRH